MQVWAQLRLKSPRGHDAVAQQPIKARIGAFRRGTSGVDAKYAIVVVPGVESGVEAHRFVGMRVVWRSRTNRVFVGKVLKVWGKHGQLLVRFRKALPGQALGDVVELHPA